MIRPGKRERLLAKLCGTVCALLLFSFSSFSTFALPPDDQFPASIIRETQFESVHKKNKTTLMLILLSQLLSKYYLK